MQAYQNFKLYKSILNHSSAYDMTHTLAESADNISTPLPTTSKTCTFLKEAVVLIYLILTPLFPFLIAPFYPRIILINWLPSLNTA